MDNDTNRIPTDPNEDQAVEAAGINLGQNIGVYLLDAATAEERTDFVAAAEALPEVRAEAVRLAPVIVVLGRVYDLNPEQAPEAFDVSAEASPELKARVLASAAPAAGTAPTSIATAQSLRPQGRVRGGTPARAAEPTPIRRGAWRTPWVAAAAMLIVAVGVALWALAVQNKYDDQSREMHAQSTEIAQVRASSNASAFTITATSAGPAQAGGTLFYSPKDQQAVLVLANMPAPKANSVYQLWYINGSNAPAPGATFKPNADGSLVLKTNASINSFGVVALTQEPAGGSKTPTAPVLMTGTVAPAAG